MKFTGNPGTGKTTVARMVADLFFAMGITKKRKVVEVKPSDLISGWKNVSAQKTSDKIAEALGGVLFIDEVYGFVNSNEGGIQALQTILVEMENNPDNLIVIMAGYKDQMDELMKINPGIASRIGYTFDFDDYTPEELVQIYERRSKSYGLVTNKAALNKIYDIMAYFSEVPNFGNGRFVDHVIHQIILKRAKRFDINSPKNYRDITTKDIPTHKEIIDTAPNKSILYDPAKITKAERRKTAIHECGHAVVMYVTDKKYIPKCISVRNKSGSLGRVELPERYGNMSEQDMRNQIATLLAGRNAERVFFGQNWTGVSSDYERAKRYARNMIRLYAMGEIGKTTAVEILKEEDARSTKIIEENKAFIEHLADQLLNDIDIKGDDFVKLYKEYKK